MTNTNLIQEKVKELSKLLNLREETVSGFDEIGAVQNALLEVYALAKREVIQAIENGLYKDHSKCPVPQSCIGYQNCVSDIDNIIEPFKNKSDTTS